MMREMIIPFAVGLAIFLFGMRLMQIGFEHLAGNKMKELLGRMAKTPVRGFLTGAVVTMILQSSSAVTLLTIGLAGARQISFPQTVGIILGTNVGTTFTTQLIALPVAELGVPLLLAGGFLWFVPRRIFRFSGLVLGGFACIFIGLELIQTIALPLMKSGLFQKMIGLGSENSVIGVLLGTVLTALIQSSTATTAITMSFIAEHTIPLSMAIAILLGSNIGTCITGWLASLGGSLEMKRVAWTHILFNIAGVILFIPFIGVLTLTVAALTSSAPAQTAHAQTIFNLICSLAALPFAHSLSRFIERVIR